MLLDRFSWQVKIQIQLRNNEYLDIWTIRVKAKVTLVILVETMILAEYWYNVCRMLRFFGRLHNFQVILQKALKHLIYIIEFRNI